MNYRLRNVLMPTAQVAVAFGILVGVCFLIRATLSIPVFGGVELFLWAAISVTTFVVALAAEAIPGRFRPKYFVLGSLYSAVILGCAPIASWLRTGQSPSPDAATLWICGLFVFAAGLVFHFAAKRIVISPPNSSLERARGR